MEQLIKVVLVEDDPMVLELNRQYVRQINGFEIVGQASDGAAALELITALSPQLVILDIYMPNSNGLELLRQVRSLGLNIDAILVTAAHNAEYIQAGLQYGAVDYIVKPFTFQRLKKSLTDYKNYINKLKAASRFSQQDIDNIKNNVAANFEKLENVKNLLNFNEDNLPKGLDKSTLRLVLHKVREQKGYFTVAEISKSTGISRVTARRYLNYLYDSGWLKATLSYGPVGRPLHKYIAEQTINI